MTENTEQQTADEKRRANRRNREKRGMILVNTGDGKGKTTAALGVVLRMLGRGKRVCVIQFLKHESGNWGEVRAAKGFDGLDWIKTGDGFTWTSKDIDETQAKALHGWQLAQEKIASGDYDLVLLDEFTYLMHFAWIDTADTIDWLRTNKPEQMHLIITGRNAPRLLIDYADTVTEMTKVKHAFDAGISAVAGIEF